jgi:DNA-binding LytR/AlgR family response regulator
MSKLACITVDDEPLSRDVLRNFIHRVKDLELVAECADAFEAAHQLGKQRVDLLFLDINMPGLTGISLVRSLVEPPLIIFTTAYPQFAVEGFELDALDYLVKPYSFERFLRAVNRAMERLPDRSEKGTTTRKIIVKADRKLYAVEPSEILFIEGVGDYIRLHLAERRLVVHETIRDFLEALPGDQFMRIHKSYVVNLGRISYIEGNQVWIGSETVPVSPTHREELLKRFSTA